MVHAFVLKALIREYFLPQSCWAEIHADLDVGFFLYNDNTVQFQEFGLNPTCF